MAATRLIAMHIQKNRSLHQCIKDRTDYAVNGEKTEDGEYISSYECDPETVDKEFEFAKSQYSEKTGRRSTHDVIAYQIRQSFKPEEITPVEANRVGYETAMRWTKGNHAFIVATHVDRKHIHNHIIYNSTTLDCMHKFRNFLFSGIALQKVSDLVCLENGLSVIIPRKLGEREKRTIYPREKSIRDQIREDFDKVLLKDPKNMDEFIKLLDEEGYQIKRGKHISVHGKEQKAFIRIKSLGVGYREEDLEKVFSGEKDHQPSDNEKIKYQNSTSPKKMDMLLDIQEMIARGKGPGYERWAKVHNIKQISQTLLFLDEKKIREYDELADRASCASKYFGELSQTIKSAEKRMAEIAVLKTHIINYSKTKDIYVAYRKAGYSKAFFEAHREEILLHKAAKDIFSNIEGQIPTIRNLNEEYGELIRRKKEAYAEYRQAKETMKGYQIAKHNIDQFLGKEEQERQEKERNRNSRLR